MAPNDVEMAPNDVEIVVPLPKMAAPLMRHSLPRFAVPALPLESATYAGSVSLPVTSAKKCMEPLGAEPHDSSMWRAPGTPSASVTGNTQELVGGVANRPVVEDPGPYLDAVKDQQARRRTIGSGNGRWRDNGSRERPNIRVFFCFFFLRKTS